MILDLSKYAETIGTYSDTEAAKAVEDKHRQLEAGIHECTLVEFKKMVPYDAPIGTEPQSFIEARDPNWLMFTPIFGNIAGQQTAISLMMPLTGTLQYLGKKGPTTYPYKTFAEAMAALGFDPLEDARPEDTFMKAMVKTNGECLQSLIGAQVKVKVEWSGDKFVHPLFVDGVFYLVNCNGNMPEELNEPFELDRNKKGDERWAEMEIRAKEAGFMFENQASVKLLRHDTVKNDLSVFFPKKVVKPAVGITKIAPKPLPKPAVATISNPPVATQPPAPRIIPDEVLLEDEALPPE